MTVRVVLDTTALIAYARLTGLAVGELVNSVADDPGGIVGVPAACYLSACEQVTDDERGNLVQFVTAIDGVTAVLPLLGNEIVEIGELNARTGAGLGHAIMETVRHGAILATYAGATARRELPEKLVLDLED